MDKELSFKPIERRLFMYNIWWNSSRYFRYLLSVLFFILTLVCFFLLAKPAHGKIVYTVDIDKVKIHNVTQAILYLVEKERVKVTEKRAKTIAKYMVVYGNRWKVDPYIGVSIACQESLFKDRPRRIKVIRCHTVIQDGIAKRKCIKKWPGERGIMQVVPRWSRESYKACFGKRLEDPDVLYNTKVNVCVGMHLLAKRRSIVAKRSAGMYGGFVVRGASYRRSKRFGPCGWAQIHFCKGKYSKWCKRLWWVGTWNWGSHRMICNRVSRVHNFAGYPIAIIRRYVDIVNKFKWKHTVDALSESP